MYNVLFLLLYEMWIIICFIFLKRINKFKVKREHELQMKIRRSDYSSNKHVNKDEREYSITKRGKNG